MSTSKLQPIPCRGQVPEPRGSIRVFRSYDELPDKWKKILAGAQPTPAGPAVPVPAGPIPVAKQFQYSDLIPMDTNQSTPTPLELPSDALLLALAANADAKLQNQTDDTQFISFYELTADELMAWVILHT